MATVIVILFVLAIWHLVIESIVMPSVRFNLRCKLFALRDKLRQLRLEKEDQLPQKVFNDLDRSISSTIRFMPHVNFSTLIETQRAVNNDEKLKKKIEKRIDAIESCEIAEVKEIADMQHKYAMLAVCANVGAWAIYLLPIVLGILIASIPFGIAKRFDRYVQSISYAPDHEVENVLSHHGLTGMAA